MIIATFIIYGILGIVGAVIAAAMMTTISTRRLELKGETSLALFPFFVQLHRTPHLRHRREKRIVAKADEQTTLPSEKNSPNASNVRILREAFQSL